MEVSGKRYRYTGKERDEETGLYYHGARHYAAWLARWTSADPAVMVVAHGIDRNAYAYVRGRVTIATDPLGLWDTTTPLAEALLALGRAGAGASASAPRPVPGRGLGVVAGFALGGVIGRWFYPRFLGRPFGESAEVRTIRDNAENIGIYDRAAGRPKEGVRISGPISEALGTGTQLSPAPASAPASNKPDPQPPQPRQPATITLYHGTSMTGAVSIKKDGVNMARGRENLDFGQGFYTTTDAEQAWDWAKRKAGERGFPAVVKITIKVEDLRELKGLHFTSRTPNFEKFVIDSRAGKITSHGFDFIEGPAWLNPPTAKNPNPGPMKAGKQQTSFHGAKAEDVLNRSTREILAQPYSR